MAEVSTLLVLSGSSDGQPIKVAATSTPGTLIHTASSTATDIDRILIKACNTDIVARDLTIEWGGVTSPDNLIKYLNVPPGQAETIVVSYSPLKGNATPKVVRAFGSAANIFNLTGEVLRVSQT